MAKQYPVRLVGEQHYDQACSTCAEGDPVLIFHEIGNPHDTNALVAKNRLGDTIGYIPRESFVQGVFHEQGRSVTARITEKFRENGHWQITLGVTVVDAPGRPVQYKASTSAQRLSVAADDKADYEPSSGRNAMRLLLPAGLGLVSLLTLINSGSVISVVFVVAAAMWLAISWQG